MYDTTKPYTQNILDLVKETWETPYCSLDDFVLCKKFSFDQEYGHTDGIGEKGIYHWKQRSFKEAIIDALAMNYNDLLLLRARPYAVIDHLMIPEDDHDAVKDLIRYLTFECKKRDVAIIGGETAIHNSMQGLEISLTMLGFIEKPKINQFQIGDILLGIESSGLHSNGFTKVIELFGDEYRKEFIEPTNIYLDDVLNLDRDFDIHGMMHITGGSFTKLRSLLHDSNVFIYRDHGLEPQNIFFEIYNRNVSDEEMYKTFNCGIGFVLSVNEQDCDDIISRITDFKVDIIGEVLPGNEDVMIESKFSNGNVVL
ncbi:hypothetical protein CL617_00470 [archaeon]|nr:hypothetical protein [archaeon]|tara:strand:+ start:6231 stop:7166 length:936 start_codon:yes stop_codon:yes gene_type:complete